MPKAKTPNFRKGPEGWNPHRRPQKAPPRPDLRKPRLINDPDIDQLDNDLVTGDADLALSGGGSLHEPLVPGNPVTNPLGGYIPISQAFRDRKAKRQPPKASYVKGKPTKPVPSR